MDEEISPSEVHDRLSDADDEDEGDAEGEPTLVDIRERRDFERGHIPGSLNVPMRELPDRITELEGSDHIVTVCPHGIASVQAARLITSYEGTRDARVESMAGGLEAWEWDLERGSESGDGDGSNGEEQVSAADEGPQSPF